MNNVIKDQLKRIGIAMIIFGSISIIFPDYLNPLWGILLIISGILNLSFNHIILFLLDGIIAILAGIINIGGGDYLWKTIGLSQLWCGIDLIKEYKNLKNIVNLERRS